MGAGSMVDQEQELHVLIAVFDREGEATEAINRLRQMVKDGLITVQDAATVQRHPDLRVHVTDIGDPSSGRDAEKGMIAGGVLGLIFPPSILIGAAVGARARGGIYGYFRDMGYKNADLEKAGEGLRPGQSALIAIARNRSADQISSRVQGYVRLDEYLLNAETGAIVAV
jgi:uncharacterized membrane protein